MSSYNLSGLDWIFDDWVFTNHTPIKDQSTLYNEYFSNNFLFQNIAHNFLFLKSNYNQRFVNTLSLDYSLKNEENLIKKLKYQT